MSLYVLDTDILTLLQNKHPTVLRHASGHPNTSIVITVISVEEQLRGWYTKVRKAKKKDALARAYLKLTKLVIALSGVNILTLTELAIDRDQQLRQLKLKIGTNDLRIAAITLENTAILVTRNTRDF